jgi:hypothetical protein
LKTSLGYTARPCVQKKKKNERKNCLGAAGIAIISVTKEEEIRRIAV